jgi:hypothetical protein
MQGVLHAIHHANSTNHLQENVMETNANAENNEKSGSGFFLWIFIGINVAFAVLVVIRFIWG